MMAQKKEDILALQRDVALVQADVAAMKRSMEDKLAAITALLQQSIEGSAKTQAAIDALEKRTGERFAAQEKTLAGPVSDLAGKMSGLTDEMQFVRESVAGIDGKVSKLGTQLTDLENTVRVLQAPPPPPATGPEPTAQSGPPAGLSAEQLYNAARGDMSSGKNDIAMQEFQDYLKWFDKTDYAPNAQFYIGSILFTQGDFVGAVTAFDQVLEKYPDNANKSADSLYMKGRSLAQLDDKEAAAEQFRTFLKKYPRHELTAKVQGELKAVSASAPPPAKKRKR
jgi:tol-pal system protein YbgF